MYSLCLERGYSVARLLYKHGYCIDTVLLTVICLEYGYLIHGVFYNLLYPLITADVNFKDGWETDGKWKDG